MIRMQDAVEAFRIAACFPEQWRQSLDMLVEATRSDGASIQLSSYVDAIDRVNRPSAGEVSRTLVDQRLTSIVKCSTRIEPLLWDYVNKPMGDPRIERVRITATGEFLPDYASFSHRELMRDDYYQEFLAPRGFRWHAAAFLSDDLILTLRREIRRGPFEGAELANLNAMLPWLRAASRAATLAWRANFCGQLSAFDSVGVGGILIDRRGAVLETNSQIPWGDGLDIAAGQLVSARSADQVQLQKWLKSILEPTGSGRPPSSPFVLPRKSNTRPLLLDGIACGDGLRSLHSNAAAMILVTDLQRRRSPDMDKLRLAFGLTRTEAQLARIVAIGDPLRTAAAQLSITESHARQRLQAVFEKTQCRRQGELIALLSKLSK